MARPWRAALVVAHLALVSGGTVAQELQFPPGVLLLSRIKRHVRDELEHLPAYTCLETVERSTNAVQKLPGASHKTPAKPELRPLDTIRLEILYTGHKEMYASPGARTFGDEGPGAYIASGMIGDGLFAGHLHTIFLSGAALFTWRGEETVPRDRGWASAVKYDFRVPLRESGWHVTLASGSAIVGEKGSFWADPETLELLRVEIHGDDIPVELGLQDIVVTASYGRMRIGESDVMLPQSAELKMIQTGGQESVDQFDFTHCRSYSAESSISFGGADSSVPKSAPAVVAAEAWDTLPAGVMVPITLSTGLTNDSTVGAMLEGIVSEKVEFKGKALIPQGAPVHGRIRRLEHYPDAGGFYAVGLEFTDVEAGGKLLRFYADLQSATGAPGLEMTISNATDEVIETFHFNNLPGVGSFFIRNPRFALPAGFRMLWKTRTYGK